MASLDVIETIKKFRAVGKINPRYDLTLEAIQVICHMDMNVLELVCNGFVFGYAQGYKAKTAETNKRCKIVAK